MTNRRLLPVAVLLLLAIPLLGDTFPIGGPRSTDNDDSCDIATLPAATLLLPYFEVDIDDFEGETTLFTVTNVGDRARVVRVTLWTDYGYPVVSFNIYLTGYDVQSINLRDVLASGRIGADEGTGTSVSPVGDFSRTAGAGYNLANCTTIPHLGPAMVAVLQEAFTEGEIGSCEVGHVHANAVGYATMDVVSQCTGALPTDDEYFTEDIRYENVLTGEYQQVHPANAYAQGGTLVHIRAIPEGGTQTSRGGSPALTENFPRTFYQRFLPDDTVSDARQPLPATFFARWIDGTSASYETSFKIWRELASRDARTCGRGGNDTMTVAEIVMFDEAENAFSQERPPAGDPPRPAVAGDLPGTARINVNDSEYFPRPVNGANAGWVYLNLDSRDAGATFAEQAWAISSMRAEGRYSVDMDATGLGNGCSPRAAQSETSEGGTAVIGPAPNATP